MMKKLVFLNFLVLALVFASCSSDDNNSDNDSATDCEVAQQATADAAADYDSASDDNFANACNAYRAALENEIDACGDEDGSLQAKIDGLGDCSNTPPESGDHGVVSVTAGTLPLEFDDITVTQQNGLIHISGAGPSDYTINFDVAEGTTGTDVIQNFQITLISTFYPSDNPSEQFDFDNEITVNENGQLTGTFSGVVTNDDGGDDNLYDGQINVNY